MHSLALEHLISIGNVFENLVECMTAMEVTVGVWWAIVKYKFARRVRPCTLPLVEFCASTVIEELVSLGCIGADAESGARKMESMRELF